MLHRRVFGRLLMAVLVLLTFEVSSFAQTSATNCTKPNVLIVFNKSSKMPNADWFPIRLAIGNLVNTHNTNIRFGMVTFDTSPRLTVSMRDNAVQTIAQSLLTMGRSGNANHRRAMQGVVNYFRTQIPRDSVTGRTNVVILVTNGTTDDGNPSTFITQLRNLTISGRRYDIKTYVVRPASSNNISNLTAWARAGGTTASTTYNPRTRQLTTVSNALRALHPAPKRKHATTSMMIAMVRLTKA